MQILRSRTDLNAKKSDIKQIFPDTAPQPKPPAHIKEQTDERISQTILRIQSNQAKRELFPGFPVRHFDRFDAPAEEQYCLRQNRLYKPHTAIEGTRARSERPPAGPNFSALLFGEGGSGGNFAI